MKTQIEKYLEITRERQRTIFSGLTSRYGQMNQEFQDGLPKIENLHSDHNKTLELFTKILLKIENFSAEKKILQGWCNTVQYSNFTLFMHVIFS